MTNVLIIDDEEKICSTVVDILKDEGYTAFSAFNVSDGIKVLNTNKVDILLLDIWLSNENGMDFLDKMVHEFPAVKVIMISGHGTVNLAVDAIKNGAFDFIEKPLSIDRLLSVVEKAIEAGMESGESSGVNSGKDYTLIGESPLFNKVRTIINNTSKSMGRVLIYGENGTGKEMVACNIHLQSDRSNEAFIDVNCAAIPENLIESELFGYEKGAFTGAEDVKVGKFELAHKGTIFLDEIADMSLQTQAKVLRVLQEMKFERVGGVESINVDVRVIAATNKNLKEEIKSGNFREDLFYRLNVIPITVPALRERKEDILTLVYFFIDKFSMENKQKPKKISKGVEKLFLTHDWPGNVRELRNMVERLCIMVPEVNVGTEDVLTFFSEKDDFSGTILSNVEYKSLKKARNAFEKEYIRKKLIENSMNVTQTAKDLGIERSNLHRKINSLEIQLLGK